MFKRTVLALLALLMFFAVSCNEPATEAPVTDDVQEDVQQPVPEAEVELDPDPTSPYSTVDMKSFMAKKYADAREAYFWFLVNGMPAEENIDINSIKQIDNKFYYKVEHETIKTLSDLKDYLNTLFAENIVNGLFIAYSDRYIDVDGELWSVDASRGTNIFIGNILYSISEKTEDKIVYTADAEIYGEDLETVVGMESHSFTYEKTDDGWRWTSFYVFE